MMIGGLMTIASLFMGKKKKEVKETSTWKPEEVRSMAPYMGMDIAPIPQMYTLEKSRYLGRSGPIQVNINIDKISGADETIAETISKKVSIGLTKVLPKDYARGINRGELSNRLLF